MYVKPAEGREVRDPVTQHALPPEGREVPSDTFWLRRLRDGDVEKATPPETGEQPKKAALPDSEKAPAPARAAGKNNTVGAGAEAKG